MSETHLRAIETRADFIMLMREYCVLDTKIKKVLVAVVVVVVLLLMMMMMIVWW